MVNVWDRALTEEEINQISTCQNDLQGNYILWEAGWILYNITSFIVPLKDLCQNDVSQFHFWFPEIPFSTADYLCLALGTDLPRVKTFDDITYLSQIANKTYPETPNCAIESWISLTDLEEEGTWKYYDGEIPENLPWARQEPNGLHYENCAVIFYQGIADVDCKADKKCAVCSFSGQQRFSFLGTCEGEVRNVYFNAYQNTIGELFFMGYGEYYIRKESSTWLWVDDVKNQTVARMEYLYPNFPMGRRWWKLERAVCDQKPGDRRQLLLSPCNTTIEFTCDDGTCISHNKLCDLKYDCRDNSDEVDCEMVSRPLDYQQQLPPRSSKEEEQTLPIILTVNIESINVKTIDMSLELSYELMLTWEDSRLQYRNLKTDPTLNVLPFETMEKLWTPKVSFINTNGNHRTYVDDDTVMMVDLRAVTKWRDETAPAEVDIYPGNINTLTIKRKYGTTYNCDFNLAQYPFDFQQCYMHLKITSSSKAFLNFDSWNSSVKYSGESYLAEYTVGDLTIVYNNSGTYSEARVLIPLRRLVGYALLNIYIPTYVLLVISYICFFFRVTEFDTRMMGALTVQLVIATLFSQVSSSLPKTSYFKMVDVWFLFCIAITFLIIIFLAVIDNKHFQSPQTTRVIEVASRVPWTGSSVKKPTNQSGENNSERISKISKITVLLFFIVFNIGYWLYTVSQIQ